MRQLLYVSSRSPREAVSIGSILMTSQRNNLAAGITGLLYADELRFLQVLEGEPEAVGTTFDRIAADPRHQAIVTLSDRTVEERAFGRWAMAHRLPTDAADTFDDRLTRMLAKAPEHLRGTFTGLVAARRSR